MSVISAMMPPSPGSAARVSSNEKSVSNLSWSYAAFLSAVRARGGVGADAGRREGRAVACLGVHTVLRKVAAAAEARPEATLDAVGAHPEHVERGAYVRRGCSQGCASNLSP
jgi:hypothetical protein